MEIVAYLIVILTSRYWLSISAFFSIPLSLILFWLPGKYLAPTTSFISGFLGPFLSVIASKYIFEWLVKTSINNHGVFMVAILPLLIPIYQDYKKYIKFRDQSEVSEKEVWNDAPSKVITMGAFPLGVIVGIIVNLSLF